jgi:chromosome segregation and condensation protein ScpB/DNA-binding XRE family transcriptional regulator
MHNATLNAATELDPGQSANTGDDTVAAILKRRRLLLGWSQSELARRSRVSRVAVNQIEAGERSPSLGTYEKLRRTLGLDGSTLQVLLPRAVPREFTEQHLARLAACLLARRSVQLAHLAEALGVSLPAAREGVIAVRDRLAACGYAAVDDGVQVALVVIPYVSEAVARISELEVTRELSREALEVLLVIGHLGEATRRQVNDLRLQESEGLLERLLRRGFLEKRSDEELVGTPNAYRLTTRALGVMGHATLESFQAWCQEQVELTRLAAETRGEP